MNAIPANVMAACSSGLIQSVLEMVTAYGHQCQEADNGVVVTNEAIFGPAPDGPLLLTVYSSFSVSETEVGC